MNVVNLLLCHYLSAYHFVEPLEASTAVLIGVFCFTLLASAAISLATYLTIEAPIEVLISKVAGVFRPRQEKK